MSKAPRGIKVGSTVRLKSDDTQFAMSVESVEGENVKCVWRDSRKECFEDRSFPRALLAAAKDVGGPITKIELVSVMPKYRTLETLERVTDSLGPAVDRISERLGTDDGDLSIVRAALADLQRQTDELREAGGNKLT